MDDTVDFEALRCSLAQFREKCSDFLATFEQQPKKNSNTVDKDFKKIGLHYLSIEGTHVEVKIAKTFFDAVSAEYKKQKENSCLQLS